MTKTKRSSTAAAEEAFHKHYASIWGSERWTNSLYPALAAPTWQCSLINRYVASDSIWTGDPQRKDFEQLSLPYASEPARILCLVSRSKQGANGSVGSVTTLPPPQTSTTESQQRLVTHWNLDAASVLAVDLLRVQPGEHVLDLCAAPGGKSLAIAQNIWPDLHVDAERERSQLVGSGRLCSNEHDTARHKRLIDNLKSYLPTGLFDSKAISIPEIDGTDVLAYRKLSLGGEGYDRALVDAPCSSERHIIHAHLNARAAGRVAPEMSYWRPVSYKRLVQIQVNLLMTGARAAKIGGTILYATCSIEPHENDGVVERALATVNKEAKKGAKWTVKVGFNAGAGDPDLEQTLEQDWAERTKHGWIVLPDHPAGGRWGPLFFAMLTKVAITQP